MPTYGYKCKDCGHTFEKFCSIANRGKPLGEPCPECNKITVEQQIGGAGVVPDSIMLGRKPVDEGFNEVLARIHENTPGSNLGDKLSRTPHGWR
jgi:putative FmdB family regulatory protein